MTQLMPETCETNALDNYPTVPEVSFDIRLGQRLSHIDFDYDAYITHLNDEGLSNTALNEVTVVFTPKRWWQLSDGGHDVGKKHIEIAIPKKDSENAANMVLAHETQHLIDDTLGKSSKIDSTLTSMAGRSTLIGSPQALFGSAMSFYGTYINSPNYVNTGRGLTIGGLAQVALGSAYYYKVSGIERRAREAEKQPLHVISIAK